jgi:hypothetical protein
MLSGAFWEGYAESNFGPFLGDVALETTVNTPTGEHGFLSEAPLPAENTGSLNITRRDARRISIPNVVYDAAVEYDAEDSRRDQTGEIARTAEELGAGFADLKADKTIGLLHNGADAASLAYDKLAFYAASGRTFINNVTATQVAKLNVATANRPTPEEFVESILDTIGYMLSWKDGKGRMVNRSARRFRVLTPTSMFFSVQTALSANGFSDKRPDTLTNMVGGFTLDITADPGFDASDTVMHVVRADRRSAKATIVQTDQELDIKTIGPGSESEFFKNAHFVKGKWVGGFGYGSPMTACRATFS